MADLKEILEEAVERAKRMTPEQRAEMYRAQRRSFMRAEASARVDAVDRYLDENGLS